MARPASAHPALVPIVTLLVGLALGWATNPFGEAPARAGAPLGVSPPLAVVDAPRAQEPLLPAETGGDSARTLVVGATAEAPAPAAAEPEAELDPAPASLLLELSTLLRSGRIEAALANDAQRLLRYTIEAYLTAKAPREALAVLERHPELESSQHARVGYLLLNEGDREGAVQAFLAGLERSEAEDIDLDEFGNLANADPAAALAFLDSRAGTLDSFSLEALQSQRAKLLAQTGRTDESLALLRQLASEGRLDPQALEALGSMTPEVAEAFLREAAPGDTAGASTIALAELLGRDQRTQEGVELLRGLLARQPDNEMALATLFALDAEASLQHVAASGLDLPPHLWGQAGHALQAQGRSGEAVDAWMRAFEADPSNLEIGDALREHAPAVLWSRAESIAATTRDDEVLGDLADLNWRSGRTQEATELWRRARALDPGDGEWSGKLRAVALGKDPL